MHVERHTVEIITATGGGATGYTPPITGSINEIIYTAATAASALASTADFTVTVERDGRGLWAESNITASKAVRPRRAPTSVLGATASTAPINEPVMVANDRVKIVVAQGGNTKQGTFSVIVT